MKTLSLFAAAALAVAPFQAEAGIGGRPPTRNSGGTDIPAELIVLGGLAIAGGIAGAVAAGGGGDSSPGATPTTSTSAPTATVSDIRMKTDIHRIGTTQDGYPLYTFRYLSEPEGVFHIGVMAQDLPSELVITLPDGVLAVDYSKIRF